MRRTVWISALCLATACNSHSSERQGIVTTDSGGVLIAQIPTLAGSDAKVWTTTTQFSSGPGDTLATELQEIVRATFAPDGSLWNTTGSSIMVLDGNGLVQRHVGRRGEGPGEFQTLLSLGAVSDGSMFTAELSSGRLTQLGQDGFVQRIVNHLRLYSGASEIEPITMLTDGRVLAVPWQWRLNRGGQQGLAGMSASRDAVPLLVYGRDGKLVDSLGTWQGLERSHGLPIRLARSVVYDARSDATVVGVSDSLDLSLFVGTALKLRLIAPRGTRQPTPDETVGWNDAVVRAMGTLGQPLVKVAEENATAHALPVIGGVVVDDARNVWVGEYVVPTARVRRWYVYSQTGLLLGQLELPALVEAFVPSRTELLDVLGDRLALLRETRDGEYAIEVRTIHRTLAK